MKFLYFFHISICAELSKNITKVEEDIEFSQRLNKNKNETVLIVYYSAPQTILLNLNGNF